MQNPNSPIEEWRAVVGYEGIYEVSSLGRVRSLDRSIVDSRGRRRRQPGRVRNLMPDGRGRLSLMLWREGRYSQRKVHRLVAEAFLGPGELRAEVNHKDGDPLNNALSNLEWASRSENQLHAYRMGLVTRPRGEKHLKSKLTVEQVREIRSLRGVMTQRALARRYGVAKTSIQRILDGTNWRHLP